MNVEVTDRPGITRSVPVRTIATVAILAVLVASGLILNSVIASRRDRAPYGADAVHASVRLQMVTPGQAQAAVDRLAGTGRLTAPIGPADQQQVVGQLTFHTPRNAPPGGQYALFVIDGRLGKPVPAIFATGPAGTEVNQGWDGRYNKVAAKYPWLHMLAAVPVPGLGYTDPGMSVSFAPTTAGPITFAALLDPDSLPVTDPAQQLTVALVFIGANDHIYWATKVTG